MDKDERPGALRNSRRGILCNACDDLIRARADGSYQCACRRWSQTAFMLELKRLGSVAEQWFDKEEPDVVEEELEA